MPVLVVVLDGLPVRHVDVDVTPTLWRLASLGGWAPDGGRAVMTTSTAPNLATFATGATPNRHGIPAGHVPVDGAAVPAHEHGLSVPSLFDACRAAGRSTAAVVSDPRLLGVLGAAAADETHAAQDDDGCVDALLRLLADPPDLLVVHFRLPDVAAHTHGPDSDAALAAYRETDARLGRCWDALRSAWPDWTVVVVSDHDQDPVLPGLEPVDLHRHIDTLGLPLQAVHEGGAALVLGVDRRQGRWLSEVAGVAGSIELGPGVRLVWAYPGRVLGDADRPLPCSVHGGPGTTAQVALVSGGHPAVDRIADSLRRRSPSAADWAVTVADVLDVPLPDATGRSLVG